MTPREARQTRGIQQGWVARQMGISQAYLSRLESGERPWAADLATRFALSIGFPANLISFAPSDTLTVTGRNGDGAEEAATTRPDAREGAVEYSATSEPGNGR